MISDNPPIVCSLIAFFETGTEGVHWAVYDHDKVGYSALHILQKGDYLFIEDTKNKIEWEGGIDYDFETCLEVRSITPTFKQQQVGGFWVHGLQKSVLPEKWLTWFLEERPAVLIKERSNASTYR